MKNYKDIIYLKGKESVVVNILFIVALVIFIVPIAAVFILRFLYKTVRKFQEKVVTSTAEVESSLKKVY